jgi:hypothetical protein
VRYQLLYQPSKEAEIKAQIKQFWYDLKRLGGFQRLRILAFTKIGTFR